VLKLSNLVILDGAEKQEFKRQKYGTTEKDYSVVLSESADEGFICSILSNYPSIIRVKVKDVYKGGKIGQGKKSVCFSVDLLKDDVKANEAYIGDFFRKIGGP